MGIVPTEMELILEHTQQGISNEVSEASKDDDGVLDKLSLELKYEIGESSIAAATARRIRPTLTIAESRRANDGLIGRLRRERRYFHTLAITYA
nr:hypothetical protein [Tanacetum cinerariifolium]